MATNEEHTPRVLSDESDTRYIELSTQFEQDVYWYPSVTITLAAFTDHGVMLHRLKSEETAVRFDNRRDADPHQRLHCLCGCM